jgi:choline dehydrogenase
MADTVDYLVVGAGTAGSVIAARLSEDPAVQVVLVELGGPDSNPAIWSADVQSLFSLWSSGARENWGYATVPERGLGGRSIPIARGKVLGGSSAINAMIHVRGNRRDFDRWRDLGNDGWGFDDVLPYFKRSESYHGPPSAYRGREGPVSVIDCRNPSPVSHAFVDAVVDLGLGARDVDFNGAVQEAGAGFYQSTRRPDGRRVTAASAFLRPAAARGNLRQLLEVRATRLVFDRARAVGLDYLGPSGVETIRVEREIVLCCGAFETPKLLMLSGVGPADELARHGIPVVQHLPGVGRNLQDHVLAGVVYASHVALDPPELLAEAGLFTWTPTASRSSSPDLQYFCSPIQFTTPRYMTRGPGFTLAPVAVRPRSRGSVTLASRDPTVLARVHARYLEADDDVGVLEHGVALARELAHDKAFEGLRGRELAPGDRVVAARDVQAFVRATATTVWHPAGTCRMGSDGDAVVDPELRVYGIAGLRIADASVMPELVNGNPNAAVMMIAERAVDFMTARAGARRAAVAPILDLSPGRAPPGVAKTSGPIESVVAVIRDAALEVGSRTLRELVEAELDRGPAGLGAALCLATARAFGADEPRILPLAAASELLRRSWVSRDGLAGKVPAAPAIAPAILAGSALAALGMRLVRRSLPALGPDVGVRVLDAIDRASLEATEGRAIASRAAGDDRAARAEERLRVVLKSLVWPGYLLPLRLANIVARPDAKDVARFDRFGAMLGLARELDGPERTERGVQSLLDEALREVGAAYTGATEGADLDLIRAVVASGAADGSSTGGAH